MYNFLQRKKNKDEGIFDIENFVLFGWQVQKSLKLKIEAQRIYLERFGQSNQRTTITRKTCKPFVGTSTPLPSLSKDSESLRTQSEEEHQTTIKQKIIDEDVFLTGFELGSSTNQEFYNQTWNLSWSQLAAATCQSPLVPSFILQGLYNQNNCLPNKTFDDDAHLIYNVCLIFFWSFKANFIWAFISWRTQK